MQVDLILIFVIFYSLVFIIFRYCYKPERAILVFKQFNSIYTSGNSVVVAEVLLAYPTLVADTCDRRAPSAGL